MQGILANVNHCQPEIPRTLDIPAKDHKPQKP